VAGLAKATPSDLWEIEDQGERAVPKVDFSMNPQLGSPNAPPRISKPQA
jgi:hypothetical protein